MNRQELTGFKFLQERSKLRLENDNSTHKLDLNWPDFTPQAQTRQHLKLPSLTKNSGKIGVFKASKEISEPDNEIKYTRKRPSRDIKNFFSIDLPERIKSEQLINDLVPVVNQKQQSSKKVAFRRSIEVIDYLNNVKTKSHIPEELPQIKCVKRGHKLYESLFSAKQPHDDIRKVLIMPLFN